MTCAGGQSSRCVFGDISYRLPDVFIAGATWHLRPGLELNVMARWIWTHVHDRIDIRLVGPTLEDQNLPQHIVLYRGFHDVVDTRARIAYWWRERLRVGAELRVENGAVDNDAVNAAAVDGFQIRAGHPGRVAAQPQILARRRLRNYHHAQRDRHQLDLRAAPRRLHRTATSTRSCQERANGTARPSANGTYTSLVQDFGLTFTFRL